MSNIFITIGVDCGSRSSLTIIDMFMGSYPFDDKVSSEDAINQHWKMISKIF